MSDLIPDGETVPHATGSNAIEESAAGSLAAEILVLHPIVSATDFDDDGFASGVFETCPTCRVAAPCPTRLAAIADNLRYA